MATTTVAANRIFRAHINRQPEIPAGWALDSEGVPTTSTEAAYHGGLLAPLGGYKGYGLAMLVEILSAILGGGAFGPDLGGIRYTDRPVRVSHAFIAIDVARFLPVGEFNARVSAFCEMMRQTPPASGYDEVLVAGDPEKRIEAERLRSGIPIPGGNWQDLLEAAARLAVAPPVN
jgi:LDH2 family malate/lactate/ureidoglycolate dehydrogenase